MAGRGAALLSLVLVAGGIEAGRLVQPLGPVLDSYNFHRVELPARPSGEAVQVAAAWLMNETRLGGRAAAGPENLL